MFIFLFGILLGLLFTYRHRRNPNNNLKLNRISSYSIGVLLSLICSTCLVFILTSLAPIEYYVSKTERIGSIKTVHKIHGNLHLGFGELKEEFYYRCMIQGDDAGIFSIEIPSDISIIFEDSKNPQVSTINIRNKGLWKLLTFPNDEVWAYAIHVPSGTTIPEGKIQ